MVVSRELRLVPIVELVDGALSPYLAASVCVSVVSFFLVFVE
jgi:hypothetical protein